MFRNLKKYLVLLLDKILPPRTDASVVQKINKENVGDIKKSPKVEGMSWIFPLFHYKDPKTKAIIWELKYKENTTPLELIGKILYEEIISLTSDVVLFNGDAKFLLIPVPISTSRRIERGYNQSEYIAKSILEYDSEHILLYAPQWLQKIKDTEIQSRSTSKQERMKNLIGCFEANEKVSDKYVILIDDVVTTGSTLSEARSTLFSAGAKDVFAFTIAH